MEIDSIKIAKFCTLTGWTEDAVRGRMKRGDWIDGREYVKVGNTILISIKGYEKWVNKSRASVPACFVNFT